MLIHLGALGAVVRSTALLEPIRRKYPNCYLTWVTESPANKLLMGHPLIDRVVDSKSAELMVIENLEYDAVLVVDKNPVAVAIGRRVKARRNFGFQTEPSHGAIAPATPAAQELYDLGLNNEKKFFENQKSEIRLVHEALELGPYVRDEYILPLSPLERALQKKRSEEWRLQADQPVIGLNTGCSHVIPYKKLSVQRHREIIEKLISRGSFNIVLLGGPEDTERNRRIAEGLPVVQSPTELGLRDGLVSVAATDLVVTGDSLGMHMAIAQQNYVIAWFGPTCAQEIDLYERGEKILASVPCSPCWKRACDKPLMCYDLVDAKTIVDAVERGILIWRKNRSWSSKQPSSEI